MLRNSWNIRWKNVLLVGAGILSVAIMIGVMSGCQTKPTSTEEENPEYSFQLGWPAAQPWGAQMFCDENPDICGAEYW